MFSAPLFVLYSPATTSATVILTCAGIEYHNGEKSRSLVDRPRAVPAGEILSRGLRMILAPAGEQFRSLRKLQQHTRLQVKAAESYVLIQIGATRDGILDILDNPQGHQAPANSYAASAILRVTYGKFMPTATNEIIIIHKMLMRPGAPLIERYPILKYVPGYTTELELATGRVQYMLENQSLHELARKMAHLSGSLYDAGSDTTTVAIMYVVMASAYYPNAQERTCKSTWISSLVATELPRSPTTTHSSR
ncbi:uncharacterized protein BJ212DRAFT_1487316 [Suillus subaureus]|uniref:Uncharacterized protein n=1 Tax=Suillus subaureus TaxID=48587 RepID=A0A9P7J4N7_9AGAM|nr:uncharacterized protein BJ212DRAFT_1487316 [Suillus subaureus]KAG1802516.1 hypothetical protein BJ212DRAFT_1487316 [Suillus subaureus]